MHSDTNLKRKKKEGRKGKPLIPVLTMNKCDSNKSKCILHYLIQRVKNHPVSQDRLDLNTVLDRSKRTVSKYKVSFLSAQNFQTLLVWYCMAYIYFKITTMFTSKFFVCLFLLHFILFFESCMTTLELTGGS